MHYSEQLRGTYIVKYPLATVGILRINHSECRNTGRGLAAVDVVTLFWFNIPGTAREYCIMSIDDGGEIGNRKP